MYADLCVPWISEGTLRKNVDQVLNTLSRFGYKTVALNQSNEGTIKNRINCTIPNDLNFQLNILKRVTLVLDTSPVNATLSNVTSDFDLVAIRPTNETIFMKACMDLDCDIISLDLTLRIPFQLKYTLVCAALRRGICFEVCYSPAIKSSNMRKSIFTQALELVRSTKGGRSFKSNSNAKKYKTKLNYGGIILVSECYDALYCRAPLDVINLATFWGLSQELGREAITEFCRRAIAHASSRKNIYRGVIQILPAESKIPSE